MDRLTIPQVLALFKRWETHPSLPQMVKVGFGIEVKEKPKPQDAPSGPELTVEQKHKMFVEALKRSNI